MRKAQITVVGSLNIDLRCAVARLPHSGETPISDGVALWANRVAAATTTRHGAMDALPTRSNLTASPSAAGEGANTLCHP